MLALEENCGFDGQYALDASDNYADAFQPDRFTASSIFLTKMRNAAINKRFRKVKTRPA